MAISSPSVDQHTTTSRRPRAVWKFALPFPGADLFTLHMPEGAELLTVQMQHGEPQVWALVTPGNLVQQRCFRIAGTGNPISQEIVAHVGTFQMDGGALIWHVFEVRP